MADNDKENKPGGLNEQINEFLKKANISFIMGPPPQPAGQQSSADEKEEEKGGDRIKAIREFSLKPRDIREYLDRFVIRQEDAKKVLAVAICDHYNHVRRCIENPSLAEDEYSKHNIILLGPSGVGKTYLMRCVAKLIGVPMVKADATKFSETGYVGHDVEDLARDLVKAADGNTALAQYGIIFLDEIDKIATQTPGAGRDVSGRGVQINLLKLMEETDVSLFSQTDLLGQIQAVMNMQRGKAVGKTTINTRHMLFIVSGAFDKLADQVRSRVSKSKIGFQQETAGQANDGEYLRMAATRDFIDYGFEPEFIGRLPIRVVCDALDASALEQILENSEGSVLSQYRSDFNGYGVDFAITKDAIKLIAGKAHDEKTGARGLMTVLERVFRNFKYELPSTAIKAFDVDEKVVEDPDQAVASLLRSRKSAQQSPMKRDLIECVEKFRKQHGFELEFSEAAANALFARCEKEKIGVPDFFEKHLRDLEYALRLISRNSEKTTFKIGSQFVKNPGAQLSELVAKSIQRQEQKAR